MHCTSNDAKSLQYVWWHLLHMLQLIWPRHFFDICRPAFFIHQSDKTKFWSRLSFISPKLPPYFNGYLTSRPRNLERFTHIHKFQYFYDSVKYNANKKFRSQCRCEQKASVAGAFSVISLQKGREKMSSSEWFSAAFFFTLSRTKKVFETALIKKHREVSEFPSRGRCWVRLVYISFFKENSAKS